MICTYYVNNYFLNYLSDHRGIFFLYQKREELGEAMQEIRGTLFLTTLPLLHNPSRKSMKKLTVKVQGGSKKLTSWRILSMQQ